MEFPPHQRSNVSRLEAFRAEIVSMRASNWPFLKIAAWLRDHRQVGVTKEAVRQFCKVRGIGKALAEAPQSTPARLTAGTPPKKSQVKFEYDDSEPILTRRNTTP